MPKLLLIVFCDKRTSINDIGVRVFHAESDRKKLEIYDIPESRTFPYSDYTRWGELLQEIRAKYYSLLALDPEKRGIELKVLP